MDATPSAVVVVFERPVSIVDVLGSANELLSPVTVCGEELLACVFTSCV